MKHNFAVTFLLLIFYLSHCTFCRLYWIMNISGNELYHEMHISSHHLNSECTSLSLFSFHATKEWRKLETAVTKTQRTKTRTSVAAGIWEFRSRSYYGITSNEPENEKEVLSYKETQHRSFDIKDQQTNNNSHFWVEKQLNYGGLRDRQMWSSLVVI